MTTVLRGCLSGVSVTEQRFQRVKEALGNTYRNFLFRQPHAFASYAASMLLQDPHWHVLEVRLARSCSPDCTDRRARVGAAVFGGH